MSSLQTPTIAIAPVFERDIAAFLKFVRSENSSTTISPHRFAMAIGEELETLAKCSRLNENAFFLTPMTDDVQQYLHDSIRVICAGAEISENIEKAIAWFKNSRVALFDYKTPQSLVADGRAEDIVRYLHSIELGFFG